MNCDVLQFIPESERGSNCRRNLGGTTELTERSALQPGHYTGVGANSEDYYWAAWGGLRPCDLGDILLLVYTDGQEKETKEKASRTLA